MENNNKINYLPLLIVAMLVLAFVTQFFFVKVDIVTALFSLSPMLIGLYFLPFIILSATFIKNLSIKRIFTTILILLYVVSFFQLATLFKKGELFLKDSRIHWDTYFVVSKNAPNAVVNIMDTSSTEKLSVFNFVKKEFSILPDSNTYLQSFRVFTPNGNKVLFQEKNSSDLAVYDIATKAVQKLKTADGVYSFLVAQKYYNNSDALPRMFAWVDSERVVFTCVKEDEGRLQDRSNWAYCILNLNDNSLTVSQNLPNVYKGEIGQYYSTKNGLQKATTWGMDTYDKQTEVPSPDGSQNILVDYFLSGWDGTTAWKVIWSDSQGNKKDIYRGPIPTGVYWTNDNHVFVTLPGEIRKVK